MQKLSKRSVSKKPAEGKKEWASHCRRRIAAHVIANLPESVHERLALLHALAYSFPKNDPIAREILLMRGHLLAHVKLQRELPLSFDKPDK